MKNPNNREHGISSRFDVEAVEKRLLLSGSVFTVAAGESIQAAIDAASAGDTIKIGAGISTSMSAA